MLLLAYAVYDSKVTSFATPFFMRTRGEALRGWIEVCNDQSQPVHKHAEDFSLFEIGEYDDQTGAFKNYTAPFNLGLATSFKKQDISPTLMKPIVDGINLVNMKKVGE